MTVNEGYHFIRDALTPIYNQREAGNIAALVIEKITGLQKTDRLMKKALVLPQDQEIQIRNNTTQLLRHEPVQYVLGEAWFYGLPLYVDKNVLIPRPETEELVEWVAGDLRSRQQGMPDQSIASNKLRETDGETISTTNERQPLILDIGTGSGCIAIALKKSLFNVEVYALDISAEALTVAKKNAKAQQVDIHFLSLDILKPVQTGKLPLFDMIVSNPPYIPLKEKAEMNKNVTGHEPHTALFVQDDDPLLFYAVIAVFGKQHLFPGGGIYLEIHETMGASVKNIFVQQGYAQVTVRKDMQGKDRMVKAIFFN